MVGGGGQPRVEAQLLQPVLEANEVELVQHVGLELVLAATHAGRPRAECHGGQESSDDNGDGEQRSQTGGHDTNGIRFLCI